MLRSVMNRFQVSKGTILLSKGWALTRVPAVACCRFSIATNGGLSRREESLANRRIFGRSFSILDETHSKEKEIDKETTTNGRLMMLFTCKICSTRVGKTFSKVAYTKGIVIIQCPSCKTRHLIADNLGWFKQFEGKNLEDYLKLKNDRILSGDVELNEQDLEILKREFQVDENKNDDQSRSRPLS